MDPELFPEIPEDLSGLSDDELADLRNRCSEAAAAIAAGTADVGELSASEVLERMTEARAGYARIDAEISERDAGREEFATRAAELAAEMASDEAAEGEGSGEGEGEGSGDEAAAETAEALAAEGEVAGEGEGEPAGVEEPVAEAEAAEAIAASARPAPRLPARARRFRPVAIVRGSLRCMRAIPIHARKPPPPPVQLSRAARAPRSPRACRPGP